MKKKHQISIHYKLLAINVILCVLAIFVFKTRFIVPEVKIDVAVNARTATILDAETGEILYEKNAGAKFPPASTAKVMTAVVAIENMSLEDDLIPSGNVVRVEPTIIGLKPGIKYKLKDLIAAILIKSANDAAFVIAESIAGSEKEFAKMMNRKAKELGMDNTYFEKAAGLPTGKKDRQYTTAGDLAKLMMYAKQYDIILLNMSKKTGVVIGSDNKKLRLKTHNKALLKNRNAPWGKTGYTKEARRTFIGVDPSINPKITFALLKSTDLWADITTLKDKGLELYEENRKTPFSVFLDWVKSERSIAKTQLAAANNSRIQD